MEKLTNLGLCAFYVIALFTLSTLSCSKEDPEKVRLSVRLNQMTGTLSVDDELVLTPTFTPTVSDPSSYQWKADKPQTVSLNMNSDGSVRIVGKSPGVTIVSISSPAGRILANCQITVFEKEIVDDGIVKILAIGNSFSEDALEQHLYGLANAANKNIVIGHLYIGGSSLQQHHTNITNDAAAYDYRKINQGGEKTNRANTSIATALTDENWDYISFQQASPNSGQYNTFTTPLPALYNYVKERATNQNVKYVLHQTWAYAQNSTHEGFTNYGRDQQTMYAAIVDAYNQAKTLINADLIVPAGTAIQNGRTTVVGDNFCRDGYHLDLNIGRYTASCTWFEALFGETVIGNSYKPSALTDYEAEIAQQAAHKAILEPNTVTVLVDYQDGGGTGSIQNPVYVNFGNAIEPGWNSLTGYVEGTTIKNLKDESNNYTGISLTITERFNEANPNGAKTTNISSFVIPGSISQNSYYGNAVSFANGTFPKSAVKFEGLDKSKKFSFCFFASRMDVGDNRETKYIVKGYNEEIVRLNASNNSSNIVCANNIQPDESGTITITITSGENNNNGATKFFYINALRLSPGEN